LYVADISLQSRYLRVLNDTHWLAAWAAWAAVVVFDLFFWLLMVLVCPPTYRQ
jgi:hypothetical protein